MSVEPTRKRDLLCGMVEVFSAREIVGWVAVKAGNPPVRITLHVNNMEVVRTFAADPAPRNNWGDVRTFRIALREIWGFCGKRDKLSVRADGNNLPIHEHGMFLRPRRNGAATPADLQARLAAGELFGQGGRLQLSKQLDREWQAGVLDVYQQVRSVVHDLLGYDCFLIYGTLLGAVRDNGFIGHDPDFDSAFVSARTEGRAAARELEQIGYALIDAGLDVDCKATALHIHAPGDHEARIDLFHLYFDADGKLCFPFGIAGTSSITRDAWQGTTEIDFAGGRASLPKDAEAMVEHIYGASWRVPKTGFSWAIDRTDRDWNGLVPVSGRESVYWENLYSWCGFSTGSPFAYLVDSLADLPTTVIDIGCGDGRDALVFARSGRSVLGLDRSRTGIEHAGARSERSGLAARARFRALDVSDVAAVRDVFDEARAAGPDPRVVFYLRFVLHALTDDGQDRLLEAIHAVARPGDVLAAEFRGEADQKRPKAHGKHFRRYQDGAAFAATLRDKYGFDVLDEQAGTGLSPWGDEDPDLYRVTARLPA